MDVEERDEWLFTDLHTHRNQEDSHALNSFQESLKLMPKNMFLNLTFTSLQNVTKGARHKIVISIQKLKERQNLLKSLERVSYHQVMDRFYLHGGKMGQGKLYSQLKVSSAGLTESNRLFPYQSQKKMK